jgi:hypothetical protein
LAAPLLLCPTAERTPAAVGFGGRCIFLEIFGWSIIFRKSKKNIKNSIIAEQTNLKKITEQTQSPQLFFFLRIQSPQPWVVISEHQAAMIP